MNQDNEEIVIIDFEFKSLIECTKTFYDEYGKLTLVQKKTDDKKMVKSTKHFLNKQFKNALKCVKKFIPEFTNLTECTEFFYNEYGKLNSKKKNLDDKKMYKYIRTYLTDNFKIARNKIKKLNKETISNIKKETTQTKTKELPPTETCKQLNMPLD